MSNMFPLLQCTTDLCPNLLYSKDSHLWDVLDPLINSVIDWFGVLLYVFGGEDCHLNHKADSNTGFLTPQYVFSVDQEFPPDCASYEALWPPYC